MTSHIRSRREYSIRSDNILICLYSNLTETSSLIDGFRCDSMKIRKWLTFLGYPVYRSVTRRTCLDRLELNCPPNEITPKQNGFKPDLKLIWNYFVPVSFRCANGFRASENFSERKRHCRRNEKQMYAWITYIKITCVEINNKSDQLHLHTVTITIGTS